MKEMRGQADAGRVRELILEKLTLIRVRSVRLLPRAQLIITPAVGEAGPSPALTRNRRPPHPVDPGRTGAASRSTRCVAS